MLDNIWKCLLQPSKEEPTLCRACLMPCANLQPLDLGIEFSGLENRPQFTLQYLLEEVSGCKDLSSPISRGLCEGCVDGVLSSYLFKSKCLRADRTIRETLHLLENITQKAKSAAPSTCVLANVSPLASADPSNLVLKNYQFHTKDSRTVSFVNEIIKAALSSQKISNDPRFNYIYEYRPPKGDLTNRQCPFCGKVFKYPSSLKSHIIFHGAPTQSCKICSKLFKTKPELDRHLRTHDPKPKNRRKSLQCPYCKKVFATRYGLKIHIVRHEQGKFTCGQCDKSFDHAYLLSRHRKKDHVKEPSSYECEHCGKTLASRYSLKMHLITDHCDTDDTEPLPCPQCGEVFKTLLNLNFHLAHHAEPQISCSMCFRSFFTKADYSRHYRSVHLGERPHLAKKRGVPDNTVATRNSVKIYIKKQKSKISLSSNGPKQLCPICGKLVSGASLSLLKTHMEYHAGPTYRCNTCNKSFKTRASLRFHYKEKHSPPGEQRSYICDVCGAVRPRKTSLISHMQLHKPKGEFRCAICNKIFVTEFKLQLHVPTHQNLRPELCGVCGRGFVNKKTLLHHTRLHTGDKPYECEACGRRFVSVNRKNSHFKVSHTEKTLPCANCDRLFHTRSHLNLHIKKVHNSSKVRKRIVDSDKVKTK